jgi:hypothetical protein
MLMKPCLRGVLHMHIFCFLQPHQRIQIIKLTAVARKELLQTHDIGTFVSNQIKHFLSCFQIMAPIVQIKNFYIVRHHLNLFFTSIVFAFKTKLSIVMNITPAGKYYNKRIEHPFAEQNGPINNKEKINGNQYGITQSEKGNEIKILGAYMRSKVGNE